MSKIVSSEFFQVLPTPRVAELSFHDNITILTGYNGVGKSSMLGALHTSVSVAHDGEYLFSRTNWAARITIDDGVQVSHIKLTDVKDDGNDTYEFKSSDLTLDLVYKRIADNFQKPSKSRGVVTRRADAKVADESAHFSLVNHPQLPIGAPLGFDVRTVLFCDERVYFNGEEDGTDKLEELDVFSRVNNLDKTLYLLLIEFSSEYATGHSVANLSKLLQEIRSEVSTKAGKLSKSIRAKLDQIESIQSANDEHLKLIGEINKFFYQTNREVVVGEGNLLELKVLGKTDSVKWYDFSKGEKTLLTLVLLVYLNRESSVVFLFDEPDLSLHISWQEMLLPSLLSLAPDSQFVISTHSPAMVGNTGSELIVNVANMLKD